MTIKEFYLLMPSASRNLLSVINQYLMASKWTGTGGISAQDLTTLSQNFVAYNATKELNPMIDIWCELANADIENLTAAQIQTLIRFLYDKYIDKWTKLWDYVYIKTYNPIWNVEGSDSTVRTFEHGKTTTNTKNLSDSITHGKTETNTKDYSIEHEKDSTDTETVTNNITDNDVYGFNSSSPVGASKSTNNGTRETDYTGSDTDIYSGTDTIAASGTDTQSHTGTDTYRDSGTDTERTTLTRGMNIGVQSTQSLLEQEIALREKFMYFEIVINDIIRELAINVY